MKTIVQFITFAGLIIVSSSCTSVDKRSEHSQKLAWKELSDSTLQAVRNQRYPLMIAFEADWCQVSLNNRKVLDSAQAQRLLASRHAQLLKLDCTNLNADKRATMQKLGATDIPSYVIYQPHSDSPILLGPALTPESLASAFRKGNVRGR